MTARAAQVPLIHAVADQAGEIARGDLPGAVREQGRLCLLDTIGCVIAGSGHPAARAFARGESETWSASGLGAQIRVARQLAYQGDIFELNDLIGGHASIGTVPTVLVAAQASDADGETLLRAVVAGVETTARLYRSHSMFWKGYDNFGAVVTTVLSSAGAAAAASLMTDISAEQRREALALAIATAGWGPAEVIFGDGGTLKPTQFGAAPAEKGLRAVAAARAGLTGPPRILESPIGWLSTAASDYDAEIMLGRTGWCLTDQMQRKLHACCGYIHASLDAVRELVVAGHDVASANEIIVEVPAYVRLVVAKDAPPRSENDARFHLNYMLALVAQGVYPIAPEHSTEFTSRFADAGVQALLPRIRVQELTDGVEQAGFKYNSARVTAVWADGTRATAECDAPAGSLGNPLDAAAVQRKFHALAAPRLGAERAEQLHATIMRIEEQTDSRWVADLLPSICTTVE
ncbi:MmgE/PrpD family protein [Microbacterium sp. NPDC096154]|uniref:MmgE/PrpD family protein n=1 Tax=Microbacterium sp. NPDC096154 TaxID=3155549 RepID=UPI00332886D0